VNILHICQLNMDILTKQAVKHSKYCSLQIKIEQILFKLHVLHSNHITCKFPNLCFNVLHKVEGKFSSAE